MMVSAAFAILAIGVLVYFLHHIPASIRINTVLGGIGRKLIHDIERRFPIEGGSREPERRISGTPVTAGSMGYCALIDFAELDEIARVEGLATALRILTGVSVHRPLSVDRTSPTLPSNPSCASLIP